MIEQTRKRLRETLDGGLPCRDFSPGPWISIPLQEEVNGLLLVVMGREASAWMLGL